MEEQYAVMVLFEDKWLYVTTQGVDMLEELRVQTWSSSQAAEDFADMVRLEGKAEMVKVVAYNGE